MKETTDDVREWLARAQIGEAIESLDSLVKELGRKDIIKGFLITKSRHLQLENDWRLGTIPSELYTTERNKLTSIILQLLDDIDGETEKAELISQGKFSFKKIFKDKLLLIAISFLLLTILTLYITRNYIAQNHIGPDVPIFGGIGVLTLELWIIGLVFIFVLYRIVYNYLDISSTDVSYKRYFETQNVSLKVTHRATPSDTAAE